MTQTVSLLPSHNVGTPLSKVSPNNMSECFSYYGKKSEHDLNILPKKKKKSEHEAGVKTRKEHVLIPGLKKTERPKSIVLSVASSKPLTNKKV